MAYDYTLSYSKINYDSSLDKITSIQFTTTEGLTVDNFIVSEVDATGTETQLTNASVTSNSGQYTATLNSTDGVDVGTRIAIQYVDSDTNEYSNKLLVDTAEEFDDSGVNSFSMKLPEVDSKQILQFDLDKIDDEDFSDVTTQGITVKSSDSKPSDTNSTIEYDDSFKPYLTHFTGDIVDLTVTLKTNDNTPASGNFEVTIQDKALEATSITFNPADTATDVAVDITPTLTFSRAIKKSDGSELLDSDINTDIIQFVDGSGNSVDYTASINEDKDVITITPTSNLSNNTEYTITLVDNSLLDSENIEVSTASSTFTTVA